MAEDSGEGVALLVYGGGEEVRQRSADATDEWDLAEAGQCGEACLMLHKDPRF